MPVLVCSCVLAKYLNAIGIIEKYAKEDICFISDYSPSHSNKIHGGLQEATLYRLLNRPHNIFIFSFYNKQQLHPHDKFGILTLPGSEFFQLPFNVNELEICIKKIEKKKLTIDEAELESFTTKVCRQLLKEKIELLKHQSREGLYFGNNLTTPLRAACVNVVVNKYPSAIESLIKQMNFTENYFSHNEVKEFIDIAGAARLSADAWVNLVCDFADALSMLRNCKVVSEDDCIALMEKIDNVDCTFEKISNQNE